MWPWNKGGGKGGAPEGGSAGAEHRRGARMQTAVVTCALGEIVDISRTGMSVSVQRAGLGAPGTEIAVELSAPTDSMEVRVRVVRSKPRGAGRSEVALEFVGLGEEETVALENLIRHGKRRAGVFNNDERRRKMVEALRMPDYYRLLGVGPNATIEEVQRAYRELARKYHPDVCKEEGAQERFCLINDAHSTLAVAESRATYDALYALRRAA